MLVNIHKNTDGEITLEIGAPQPDGTVRSVTWELMPDQLDRLMGALETTRQATTIDIHLEL